jgi:selenocysteine-specific elongation factor
VSVGDELVLAGHDGERPVAVRGLQTLGEPVETAQGVSRVAVNLRGVPLDALHRGDALLTPHRWLATGVVDVRLHPPRGAGTRRADDRLPAEVMLHVGSAAVAARVRPLSREDAPDAVAGSDADVEPGTRTLRLTLRQALPLRPGDRALLRDPGVHAVLGGVTVLDVRPPELRRRGAARARAGQLARSSGAPDPATELRRRRFLRVADLAGLGLAAAPPDAPGTAGWLADPAHLDALAGRLVSAVAEHAAADPLDPGLPARAAARALELPDPRLLDLVLARPPASDDLTEEGGRILRHGDGGLPPAVRAALATVRGDLEASPFAAPEAGRLAELGLGAKQLGAAVRAGELVRIADGIYLAPDAPDLAVTTLATLEQPFTVSAARQVLGTTRRVAVPLLELLARTGRTRHDGEGHQVLRL